MFGYVRPFKSELKVREYRQYKAVYCELCRVLGKEYGPMARLTLSYDLTFYALISLSVTGAAVAQEDRRCVVNPLKKCTYLASPGEDYRRAAALSVLLTAEKLRDNAADEGFWKALGARLMLKLMGRKVKKAGEKYPALKALTDGFLPKQQAAEGAGLGPDACAEPTGALLKGAFSALAPCGGNTAAVLGEFGYFLGRWIYLMDAADDLEEDLKSGRFNPFIARLGLSPEGALPEEDREEIVQGLNEALNATVARLLLAFNLLELENFGPIAENVVRLGLPEVQREILFLRVREKPRRMVREKL